MPPEDPRLSFNEVPEIYDEIRPSYPPALFDALFSLLPDEAHIVEVGPGTGQATTDLLARGATVHAVEIGPATAALLRAKLSTDRLTVTTGNFETVPLQAAFADAVFSATAYHWISPTGQLDRPAHVLRPGGIVAIVDLMQVDSPVDQGFFDAAQPIYGRHGQGHVGPPAPRRDAVDPPIRAALAADARFGGVAVSTWNWDQTYSAARYRLLMQSYSGTQGMAPDARHRLLDDIESFIDARFDGEITRPLVVTLTTARSLA